MLLQTPQTADNLLSSRQAVFATARGLILQWRDRAHLLYEIYLMGAPPPYATLGRTNEQAFIAMMRDHEQQYRAAHPGGVPPANAGLTDAQYGEVYEAIRHYVEQLARKGAKWRRRKDCRIH